MDQVAAFSEYGLAGAVIIALFYTMKVLGALALEKIELIMHKFSEDLKVTREEHRNERAEWRESQERMNDKLEITIIGLTEAIRQSNNRHRGDDHVNRG
jgi:hypothetical protein